MACWWGETGFEPPVNLVLFILRCAHLSGAQTMLAGKQPTFPVTLSRLRLSPTVEPSSTVVSLEWVDVQPAIGTKVSDYILQHKKVDEYTDTDLYTGK